MLRVLTWNIWNKQGPWPARAPLLRRGLESLAPDIVGLQEVLSLEGEAAATMPESERNQAVELGAPLGYHTAFASAWHIGGGLQFGNALLSRWPIVEQRGFQLPGLEGAERRGLLYALVDAPAGRVPLFVTHLDWELHASAVRKKQVAFIAARVAELATVAAVDRGELFPPILCGDFNAEPDSDEIRFLSGLTTIDERSVYFADCFRVSGDGPRATYAKSNVFAAALGEPDRCLDYIFVRGPDRKKRGRPLSARVVGTESDGGIFPSDHYAVLAEIST